MRPQATTSVTWAVARGASSALHTAYACPPKQYRSGIAGVQARFSQARQKTARRRDDASKLKCHPPPPASLAILRAMMAGRDQNSGGVCPACVLIWQAPESSRVERFPSPSASCFFKIGVAWIIDSR
jgi:hypothetical protein